MPHSVADTRPSTAQHTTAASRLGGLCRRVLLAKFSSLVDGRLTVVEEQERWTFGGATPTDLPAATITVHDPAFYTEALLGGTIGAAESYIRGHWTSDDLTALIRLFVRNRDLMEGIESGFGALLTPARRLFHALHRNSRRGSRHNIAAHYDLSNDFFALFLDDVLQRPLRAPGHVPGRCRCRQGRPPLP